MAAFIGIPSLHVWPVSFFSFKISIIFYFSLPFGFLKHEFCTKETILQRSHLKHKLWRVSQGKHSWHLILFMSFMRSIMNWGKKMYRKYFYFSILSWPRMGSLPDRPQCYQTAVHYPGVWPRSIRLRNRSPVPRQASNVINAGRFSPAARLFTRSNPADGKRCCDKNAFCTNKGMSSI